MPVKDGVVVDAQLAADVVAQCKAVLHVRSTALHRVDARMAVAGLRHHRLAGAEAAKGAVHI